MIFAKVDVSLARHHRVLRIPKPMRAAALGVWLAALCYTREAQLDGFCPIEALEGFATEEIVGELVRVGLFARDEQDGTHGVSLLRYAEHNDCKRDIEKRLRDDRLRKRPASTKVSRIPGVVQSASDRSLPKEGERIPIGIPAQGFPDSDSDSHSLSGSGSGISEGEREGVRPPASPTSAPAEGYIRPEDKLTAELRAAAEIVGVKPGDVETAWLKFTGKNAGKWCHVSGAWQSFCASWVAHARKLPNGAAVPPGALEPRGPIRIKIPKGPTPTPAEIERVKKQKAEREAREAKEAAEAEKRASHG